MSETWREHAACKKADVNLFFLDRGDNGSGERMRKVMAYCDACPVKIDCLHYAVDNHITVGIYGGMGAHARRAVRRQRLGY